MRRRNARRRAVLLTEILFLLPILAVISAVAYQFSTHSVRFQRQMTREIMAGESQTDLLRWLRRDAGRAASATLERDGDVTTLTLSGARAATRPAQAETTADVFYRIEPDVLVRVDGGEQRTWPLNADDSARFELESIGSDVRIVWITLARTLERQRGPDLHRPLAAAAVVGPGGTP